MNYSECYPTLQVDGIPEEAVEEVKEFHEELINKYKGTRDDEEFRIRLNQDINQFQKYLKEKYVFNDVSCKLTGPAAYHETIWSVDELCEIYEEYYPERYEDKEEYTRIEINNMLFDLHIIDIVERYQCVALPYSFAEKHNNEIFEGTIRVNCRYL